MNTIDSATVLAQNSGAVLYFSEYITFMLPQGSAHIRTVTHLTSCESGIKCDTPHTASITSAGISRSLTKDTAYCLGSANTLPGLIPASIDPIIIIARGTVMSPTRLIVSCTKPGILHGTAKRISASTDAIDTVLVNISDILKCGCLERRCAPYV